MEELEFGACKGISMLQILGLYKEGLEFEFRRNGKEEVEAKGFNFELEFQMNVDLKNWDLTHEFQIYGALLPNQWIQEWFMVVGTSTLVF